ncbi:MAG TPA: chemotaxis protein CheX [Nocardioides sp.]
MTISTSDGPILHVAPGAGDVMAMVNEVWSTFVDAAPLFPTSPIEADRSRSAQVQVTGAWSGMVTLEVSEVAARAVTRHMLAMSEITPEDVTDAIGELVNMIGGNVKSLMPEPSILSLPMVAAGHIAVPSEATEVTRLDLLWHDEPLILRIHSLENDTRSTP